MAEVAIPILALGVMYLIKQKNDDDEIEPYSKEGFNNVSAPQQRQLVAGDAKTYIPVVSHVNLAFDWLPLKVWTERFVISGQMSVVVNWTGVE